MKEYSTENFKEEVLNELLSKFPNFENSWKDLKKSLGNEFIGHIKKFFKDEFNIFNEISNFEFTIVIDNNFIFSQINGAILNNNPIEKSNLYKIVTSTWINVYAPPLMKKELFDKIEKKIKGEEAQKNAIEYANILLENINIKDAQWVEDWKKAKELINDIDPDDVPYLALAFHTKSHAIISNDAVFNGLEDNIKKWNIGDAGKLLSSYESGFISFCLIGTSLPFLETIWKLLVSILKLIADILLEIIYVIGLIIIKAIETLFLKVPEVTLIATLAIIGLSFIDEFREGGKELLNKAKEKISIILQSIKEFILWVSNILKDAWEAFKPIGTTALEIAAFLSLEYQTMAEQVEKLEINRASY